MLLSRNTEQKTEEFIVELLHNNESVGPTLFKEIQQKDPTVSKETFYRILRRLTNDEVVTKQSRVYQLNRHWLQRIYRFSKKSIETNRGIENGNILSFEEGDKISYKFKNPNLMGIYWAHTYDMVFEKHNPKIPILIYHPHEWLIHSRVDSETFFLNRFPEDKKIVFFAIGGNTNIDKKFKKDWDNTFRQIGTGINLGFKNTEYVNVLGDFIFKISVSKKFSEDLEAFFNRNKEITFQNKTELEYLCNRKDTTKMTLIRSKSQAEKMRIKFSKSFYLPKQKAP